MYNSVFTKVQQIVGSAPEFGGVKWLAYKLGECKEFETRQEAKAFSDLVEKVELKETQEQFVRRKREYAIKITETYMNLLYTEYDKVDKILIDKLDTLFGISNNVLNVLDILQEGYNNVSYERPLEFGEWVVCWDNYEGDDLDDFKIRKYKRMKGNLFITTDYEGDVNQVDSDESEYDNCVRVSQFKGVKSNG
jgi:hypothetical protein